MPVSMLAFVFAIVASFVWREYSVIHFETKPLLLALHCLYFIFVLCLLLLGVPVYLGLISEEDFVFRHLKEV